MNLSSKVLLPSLLILVLAGAYVIYQNNSLKSQAVTSTPSSTVTPLAQQAPIVQDPTTLQPSNNVDDVVNTLEQQSNDNAINLPSANTNNTPIPGEDSSSGADASSLDTLNAE